MRRNFNPQESRGLSTVWNSETAEPHPSSDAPTRPVSNNVRLGQNNAYATLPRSSSMNVRAEQFTTDNAESMSIYPQESLIPPPSIDIPDSRIAARFHMKRSRPLNPLMNPLLGASKYRQTAAPPRGRGGLGESPGDVPVELALAERYKQANPCELSPQKLEQVEEIYAVLRAAGLDVPDSASLPLPQADLYAAIRYFFELISPVPSDYKPTAESTLELLQLIGYSRDKLEVDMFALRMPRLQSAWPLVVEMLYWLMSLTAGIGGEDELRTSGSDLPNWLVHAGLDSGMNAEQYLEFAKVNAFMLRNRNHYESIPDEYVSEVKETISKFSSDAIAAAAQQGRLVDECNGEIIALDKELAGFTSDIETCNGLSARLLAIEKELSHASDTIDEKKEAIASLERRIDESRLREATAEQEFMHIQGELSREGMQSMEEALGLARVYGDLKLRNRELSDTVHSLRDVFTEKYERPARLRLTSIHIGLDEYNDNVDPNLLINSELPNDLDDVWGRTMASLLGGGAGDLSQLKREWLSLKTTSKHELGELENQVASMEAEVASLESRANYYSDKSKELKTTMEYHLGEKESVSEALASLQNQQVRRREKIEHYHTLLATFRDSIKSLTERNRSLTEEKDKAEPKLHRLIREKQRIEMMLLEYQNSYGLLDDKVKQLESANSGFTRAITDASMWINDLKSPPFSSPLQYDGSDPVAAARARALHLLSNAG